MEMLLNFQNVDLFSAALNVYRRSRFIRLESIEMALDGQIDVW